MKIAKIETVRLPAYPNLLWVQIHTADGLVGLGETFYLPAAVEAVVHDFAAPLLLGKSALDRERHWQNLFSCANFFGFAGAEMRAISALDLALWDLLGQYTGQPLFQLLGGQCRECIPVYNTCVNTPKYADQDGFLQDPGALARSLVEQSYSQMKVWPWDRFAPQVQSSSVTGPAGWSAMGPVGHFLSAADLQQGLWTIQEIRKAVGDRIAIAIEGHSRWDLNCAVRLGRALEPYDVIWMEDMIQPDSPADLQRLVAETRVPQCVSERLFTKFAYREILEQRAAHIVMIDLIWTGGMTESVKIAALADTYHLPFAPHDCTGPVNLFAALHLCAALPNAMIMEVVRGFCEGYYLELVDRPVTIQEGRARFDFGPGLGTKLRPEILSQRTSQVRASAL
ncbi:MAG: mandelate racemase/muconate lactonizing enzyme family protein [Verrucomicrobiota bacterium]